MTEATPGLVAPPARSPRVAQALSIIPGLGQFYYGAPRRGVQYFAGVVLPALTLVGLFSLNELLSARLVGTVAGPLGRLGILLVSELVELSLLIISISFWIAARWDARQGTLAYLEGRDHRPVWWFIRLKQFLFDEPEVEAAAGPGENSDV